MSKKSWIINLTCIVLLIIGGLFFYQNKKANTKNNERVVATTMAQTNIFDKLGINLVGVPTSSEKMPTRYKNVAKVGNHVSVNFEQIVNQKPSVVYVDNELTDDYANKLKQHNIKMKTLNLNDYTHLKQQILKLGDEYHKQDAAKKLVDKLQLPKQQKIKKTKVLILMGMPGGTFLVANDKSYVGDLVKRAGGTVIGGASDSLYTMPNQQVILKENPDVVIRLAHAMPTSVAKSFNETFKQEPYNKLNATKNKQIHDVVAPEFSLSANLHVVDAYTKIQKWLWDAQ